jgi:hypothetical protein
MPGSSQLPVLVQILKFFFGYENPQSSFVVHSAHAIVLMGLSIRPVPT